MKDMSPAAVYTAAIVIAFTLTGVIVLGVKFLRDRVNKLSKKFDEDPDSVVAKPSESITERVKGMVPKMEDITKAKESVKETFIPTFKASDNPFEQLREGCALLQNTEEPPSPEQIQNLTQIMEAIERQHPQSKAELSNFRQRLNTTYTDPAQFFLFLIELHKWTDQHKDLYST